MKNSLKWFFLILVVVIFSSCAEKEESDDADTTFLEGTWKKACEESSDDTYSEYIMVYKNT